MVSREELYEIKQLPPEKVLSYLGIPYREVNGNQIMALAVWRDESEPSVSIQYRNGKWLWHDFGTGEGGDWIDLYRRLYGSDFKEAVSTLRELTNGSYRANTSTREGDSVCGKKKFLFLSWAKFELIESVPFGELLSVPDDLKEYLERKGFMPYWERLRGIQDLYYLRYKRRGNREYSGLATKTLSGNWIIKNLNGTFASKSPAGLSYWNGKDLRIAVVEGFTDGIALRVNDYFKDFRILILNGLGNLKQAISLLERLGTPELYIVLDLDESGRKARAELRERFPESKEVFFEGKDPAEKMLKGLVIR